MFSASNPSLRSSHSAALENQLQIRSQRFGQGYRLEIVLTYMFLMVGETGVPGENPREHGENMQTPCRKVLPRTSIVMVCPCLLLSCLVYSAVCPSLECFICSLCLSVFSCLGMFHLLLSVTCHLLPIRLTLATSLLIKLL